MKYTDKIIRRMLFEWIVKEFKELRLARRGTEDLWLEARQAQYAIIIEGYASLSDRWNSDILIVIWPGRNAVDLFPIMNGKLKWIESRMVEGVDEEPKSEI